MPPPKEPSGSVRQKLPDTYILASAGIAALVLTRTGVAFFGHGNKLVPDFSLYTQGGVGLWPTPTGRFLGMFGQTFFGGLSVVSAGAITFMIGLIARSWVPALLFAVYPLALWVDFASIDNVALAVFLLGVLVHPAFYAVGASLHLQLVPYAFAAIVMRGKKAACSIAAFLALITVIALLLTPYSALVYRLASPVPLVTHGFVENWSTWIMLTPLILLSTRRTLVLTSALLAAFECGLQHHASPRYFMLTLALGCIYFDRQRVTRWAQRGTRVSGQARPLTVTSLVYGGSTNSRHSRDSAT